jgi:very-short-patch-repair endonuclease
LVVEVDGPSHRGRHRYDRQRDRLMRAMGLAILRLSNDEVLTDPERTIARIEAFVARRPRRHELP